MKFESLVVLLASLLGIAAKAQPSAVKITSQNTENLFKASGVVDRMVAASGNQHYNIEIDSNDSSAKVTLRDSSDAEMDALVEQIYREFGNSVKIEKVPVKNMSMGSQDGWMK